MKTILTIFSMAILIGCGGNNSSNNTFSISAGEDKIGVLDENITLGVIARGDYNGTLSYEWKEGEKLLGTNEELIKNDFSKGEHILTVTATDANGLKVNDRITVKIGVYVLVNETIQQPGGSGEYIKRKYYTYDTHANLIRVDSDFVNENEEKIPDGIIDSIEYYTYDNNNNLVNEKRYQTDVEKFLKDINYTYDKNNNLLLSDTNNGSITKYTYNENGNKTSYTFTTSIGTVLNETYTYDDKKNQLTFTFNITPYGEDYNSTTTYTYNEKNQLLSQRLLFENKKRQFMLGGDATQLPNWSVFGVNYITYTYNEEGKILLKNYYSDENISKKINYSYENNSIIKSITSGLKSQIYTYLYNSQGKLISQTEVFNGKTYTIYTHNYDEQSNITQSKVLSFAYKSTGELLNQTESFTNYENFYDKLGTLIKVVQDEKFIWEKSLLF